MMNRIKSTLDLYKEVFKLNTIKRTGWVVRNIPAERIESVGEHCFSLHNLAFLINLEVPLNIDMLKVSNYITVHEYGEIVIGDLIVNSGVSKEEKYKMELDAITNTFSKHPGSSKIIEFWKEYSNGENDEAVFVFLLDKFQAVIQARLYSEEFNRHEVFKDFFEYFQGILKEKDCSQMGTFGKLFFIQKDEF